MSSTDNPIDRRRHDEARGYHENKMLLRDTWQIRHNQQCPEFHNHGIPFESCSACQTAFQNACNAIHPRRGLANE